jgi:PAS domain S-box-containing protein
MKEMSGKMIGSIDFVSLSSISVLYVEDDLDTREEIHSILMSNIGELYVAKDGQEGLALYHKHFPDIVITDIQMPVMNGLSMIIAIKALNSEQPIIITSAHEDKEYLYQAIDLELKYYLTKPIHIGKLFNILCDIAKNKQIHKDLLQNEQMLNELQHIAHIGSWFFELETGCLIWSQETYNIFGVSLNTFKPTLKGCLDFVHSDDIAKIEMWFNDFQLGKNDSEPIFRIIRPNGIVRFVSGKCEKKHNEATKSLCIMGTVQDITERIQIESRSNAIFDASVDGIIVYDSYGNIEKSNISAQTIFGYNTKELFGYNINKIISSKAKKSGECSSFFSEKFIGKIINTEGIHKNGSKLLLEVTTINISFYIGKCFASIIRDIGFRIAQEQLDKEHLDQLAHITRLGLMGEMASGIAHEVNQPLSAVATYSQVSLNMINTAKPDLAKIAEVITKTYEQSLRAGQIIHRMKEFVKSNATKSSTTVVNDVIHTSIELCSSELKQNNINLRLDLENGLQPVYVDRIQIEQVLINLIRNSIDVLKTLPNTQQRQLSIQSCVDQENNMLIRVKDNGLGLNEDQKQKIFKPFYTTKAEGMGMGLSICRSLIEAHKGNLRFNSEFGKGTTFYFTLPIETDKV